jgi:hypothetical protein
MFNANKQHLKLPQMSEYMQTKPMISTLKMPAY